MEILNISINKITSEKLDNKHLAFIDEVNHCPLCGTELNFTHQHDYNTQLVKEEGHCSSCGIRTKTQDFSLQ